MYNFNHNCLEFSIGGQPIDIVHSYKHLGHLINSQLDDNDDILEKRSIFIGQCNNIICYFNKLTSSVKQRLLNCYCTSFFGCELWALDHRAIACLAVVWRSALKRIWSVPRNTHGYLLHNISDTVSIQELLYSRSLNFIHRCLSHQSKLVSSVSAHGVYHGRCGSPLGLNFRICIGKSLRCPRSLSVEDDARSSLLKELISLRDGTLDFSDKHFLSHVQICDMIKYVTVD